MEELIPPIDPDAHDELHKKISHVPVFTPNLAAKTLKIYRSHRRTADYMIAIDNLLRSVDTALEDGRFDRFERVIGELGMEAIQAQKPYLELTPRPKRIDLKPST